MFGRLGATTVNDTTSIVAGAGSYDHIVQWGPLFVYADTVFNTTSCVVSEGDGPVSGFTYVAGVPIYMPFTTIKLVSGTIHAQNNTE